MEKIPTIFDRDWDGDRSRVLDIQVPGCEWVFDGEGKATRKYDGTCVMFDGEKWWARREVKEGKQPPAGFISSGHDHITLKNVGWEPIEGTPFVKFFQQALVALMRDLGLFPTVSPGTYELIGPKINKNPEGVPEHLLVQHDRAEVIDVPDRSFAGIEKALSEHNVEGFVFHHEDGRRMGKIKKRDFGHRR